jgi:hypothetical protein
VLNAHSRTHCGPEITFFRDFYGRYRSDPIAHLRFASSARSVLPEPELLAILGRAFVEVHERAAALQGKPRWADKNPENGLYVPQWQALLGDDWLFVHVVRDPLDTLASMETARFPLTLPSELDARIQLFVDLHEAGLRFGERYPERYLRIHYESLAKDPEQALSLLMRWLGDSPEPRQLSFNSVEHQIGLEDPKIRDSSGILTSRIGRWREVLSDAQADAIRAATAGLWARLASRREPSWT